MERREHFHTLANPLMGGDRGELQNLRGEPQTGPWKKKWKEFTTDLSADSTSQSETFVCVPAVVSGGWVFEARALEIGPLGEDWGKGHDESLKGPVQHSRGFRESLCQPER